MHPNVKLFISHGGISGVYEAVHAGVPVLGFPLFYDQPRNVENLVDNGMAIAMDLSSVSKDSFLKNILELINNEKYERFIVRITVQNLIEYSSSLLSVYSGTRKMPRSLRNVSKIGR